MSFLFFLFLVVTNFFVSFYVKEKCNNLLDVQYSRVFVCNIKLYDLRVLVITWPSNQMRNERLFYYVGYLMTTHISGRGLHLHFKRGILLYFWWWDSRTWSWSLLFFLLTRKRTHAHETYMRRCDDGWSWWWKWWSRKIRRLKPFLRVWITCQWFHSSFSIYLV